MPLVGGVFDGLGDVAAREVPLAFSVDEEVEYINDGKAAGAADECAEGRWCGGLAGLPFDVID